MTKLTARSPEDIIAVVPHMLGFQPEESLVVIGVGPGVPAARVDLPRSQAELDSLLDTLGQFYAKTVPSDTQVVLVAFGEDLAAAEIVSRALAQTLADVGVDAVFQLGSYGDRWVDLNIGLGGYHSPAAVSQMAATAVAAGRPQPLASREQLSEDLVGDREPIAEVLPAGRNAAADLDRAVGPEMGRMRDQTWAVGRLQQFWADGNRLSDPDAARLLVALEHKPTRDTMWLKIDRDNATSCSALWADLTRRAPDEVRAAPATLLAFSSWLDGAGARAWCALDQVPPDQPYPLAELIGVVLQEGHNPRLWDTMREGILDRSQDLTDTAPLRREARLPVEVDESYVPGPRNNGHDTHRDLGGPATGRDPGLTR